MKDYLIKYAQCSIKSDIKALEIIKNLKRTIANQERDEIESIIYDIQTLLIDDIEKYILQRKINLKTLLIKNNITKDDLYKKL